MIVTTYIDLSAKAYRFFLHQAQKSGKTPEAVISSYLEGAVANEIDKQKVTGENELLKND